MKVFAIADLHLGHDNLALHRGFNSCQQQVDKLLYRI